MFLTSARLKQVYFPELTVKQARKIVNAVTGAYEVHVLNKKDIVDLDMNILPSFTEQSLKSDQKLTERQSASTVRKPLHEVLDLNDMLSTDTTPTGASSQAKMPVDVLATELNSLFMRLDAILVEEGADAWMVGAVESCASLLDGSDSAATLSACASLWKELETARPGGFSEWFVWREDFQERRVANAPFEEVKKRIWEILAQNMST